MHSDLPVELILCVLDQVYYKNKTIGNFRPDRTPDYQTLASCSLINSTWRTPSQSLLFNHVTINAASRFARKTKYYSLSLDESALRWQTLCGYVRILELRLRNDSFMVAPLEPHQFCEIDDFRWFLTCCTRLYELQVHAFGIFSLASLMPADTSYPTQVRALLIGNCSIQSPILYELLSFFPSVQFLTVGIEVAARLPPNFPGFKLYELVLYRSISTAIFRWLIANSEDTLSVIELRDLPSTGIRDALQKHRHQLQSLRLMHFNKVSADIVRSCDNLQELILLVLSSVTPLRELPPTLLHLSLIRRASDGAGLSSLEPVIQSLPKLKLMICDHSFALDPGYLVLRDICNSKGAKLLLDSPATWPNDEPVIVSWFPRGRYTSNFRLMNQYE